jgi:hypothetical protein
MRLRIVLRWKRVVALWLFWERASMCPIPLDIASSTNCLARKR